MDERPLNGMMLLLFTFSVCVWNNWRQQIRGQVFLPVACVWGICVYVQIRQEQLVIALSVTAGTLKLTVRMLCMRSI